METEELTERKVSFTRGRRWSIGFHVVLSSIALLAVISMLNYLAQRHNHRFYVSNPVTQKLSPLTLRTLNELTNTVKVVCFFDRTDGLFGAVSTLLKEYQARSPKIDLEFVDYRMPGRAEAIRAQYKMAAEGQTSRIIFDAGGRVRTVLATELSEYGMTPTREIRRTGFRGEQLFTSAILNVTKNAPVTAFFLQGHGEHALGTDQQGYSEFGTMLQNNSVKVYLMGPLLGTNGVPADCGLLVIGGATRRFEQDELVNIDRYLARGGRLLVFMGMTTPAARITPTGLEALLHKWNIDVGFDYVQDAGHGQAGDKNIILTANYGSHAIVRALQRSRVKLVFPRSVSARAAQANSPDAPKVTELLFTSQRGQQLVAIDESGSAELRKVGAIPLAVAAERGGIQGVGADTGSSRVVVVGESMLASNAMIADAANSDFVNQIVNWLVSRDALLGEIGPSPMSEYKILLTEEQLSQMRWLFMGAIPGFVIVFGFFVWMRRRV
jgi:ABC-2 type transport system permease protein